MAVGVLSVAVLAVLPRVTEPQSGLTFQVPAATPCVYVPDVERSEFCPEVDRSKLPMLGVDVWLFATSVDSRLTLVANRVTMRSAATMSSASIDEFVRGATDAASTQAAGGRFEARRFDSGHFRLSESNGFKNARFVLEPDLRAQQAMGRVVQMAGAMIPSSPTG